MADRILSPSESPDDARFDRLFRPNSLDEYIGQSRHKENLKVFVQAARGRKEPLDHILFCGPPGLGKTTLAHILSREMGTQMHSTSGPAIEHKGALAGLLTKLEAHDVLFIDEIHRLTPAVEESLYPAIEAFRIDGAKTFALAVQWHPEWKVMENPFSRALFAAFGRAGREHAARRAR